MSKPESPPIVVLLVPWANPSFLTDQITDLTRSAAVKAVYPGRLPFGSLGRLPGILNRPIAWFAASRMKLDGTARVVVVFHPWQMPLARALLRRYPGCELWYSRWDRYEAAFDDGYYTDRRLGNRLRTLHREAADTAALIFAVSTKLAELEHEAGRDAVVVPIPVDSFSDRNPADSIVAVSLGFLGPRADWKLLRQLGERMPELIVLLIGARDATLADADADFAACMNAPHLVWLGRLGDNDAACLMACADVGIVPYKVDGYNDAALPHRILKYARIGRATIAPDLANVRTRSHSRARCRRVGGGATCGCGQKMHSGSRAT